jgi:hypothetical protein
VKVAKKKENEGGDKDRAHSLYKMLKKKQNKILYNNQPIDIE